MLLFIFKLRLKLAIYIHNRSLSKVCDTLLKVINVMNGPMDGWHHHNELQQMRNDLIAQRDVLIERIADLKHFLKQVES